MAVKLSVQVDRELKKVGAKASKAVSASAKSAWRVAVRNTPRDTGNAQSGWKLSRNRRGSYVPRYGQYKAPPKTPAFSFRVTKDKKVYLWNNVPYVYNLEHGKGPGARTAHKMLAKASAHFESDLQRRLRALK